MHLPRPAFANRRPQPAAQRCLQVLARQLGRFIEPELRRFAAVRWPGRRIWGRLGFRPYRLRRRFETDQVVWWVERDVPPYDRFTCQAYEVCLLCGHGEPALVVRSRAASYPLPALDAAALRESLARAGQEQPLLIPRQMGFPKDL